MKTGEIIKKYRLQLGLSQRELGDKVGVNKAAVQKWESGAVKNLKKEKIQSLSEIFNISPNELLGYNTPTKKDYDNWDGKYNPNAELTLSVKIAEMYGNNTAIAVDKFTKLDNTDQEKVIERIDTMLEADKYKK